MSSSVAHMPRFLRAPLMLLLPFGIAGYSSHRGPRSLTANELANEDRSSTTTNVRAAAVPTPVAPVPPIFPSPAPAPPSTKAPAGPSGFPSWEDAKEYYNTPPYKMVDQQTPASQRTMQVDGTVNYTLVFSDEFERDHCRGADCYPTMITWDAAYAQPGVKWTATNTLSMDAFGDSFMHPMMISVQNGSLAIEAQKQRYQGAQYLGGQLTTWNRACFQGGYLEVKYKNPGSWGLDGLWAAIWTMGVLVRDNFMVRNLNIWPYSYSDCGCPGSLFFGAAPKPEISGCQPAPPYGLNAFQGRGAPEFDLTETNECSHFQTTESDKRGIPPEGASCMLQTIQIGPRLPWDDRPFPYIFPSSARQWYGFPWQTSPVLHYYEPTFLNSAFYGFGWYDSISATTFLDEANYSDWHTVGMLVVIDEHCEMYQWPHVPLNASMAERCRGGSSVSFFLDGRKTTTLDGNAFSKQGTTAARQVPQEPLYVLLEQKISPKFGFGTPPESALPTTMLFDV